MHIQVEPWVELFQLLKIRQQQAQTNELLDQIRRLQLTPAERAQEDVERAAQAEEAQSTWSGRCRANWNKWS
jgi:hypothetical protein